MIKQILRFVFHLLVICLLTLISQIGGLVYLIALLTARLFDFRFKRIVLFTSIYIVSTFFIVPAIAPAFGRMPIEKQENLYPATFLTDLLNRNYVTPELNKILTKSAIKLQEKGINLVYMDANFPFIDEFPLLPHLSHDDGRKVDIGFVYLDDAGKISKSLTSTTGYGAFVDPTPKEQNQPKACLKQNHTYDFSKYFTFGTRNLTFSAPHTKALIEELLENKTVQKILIEPHLKTRLKLRDTRIRFQGCHSVRHDDHLHLQI